MDFSFRLYFTDETVCISVDSLESHTDKNKTYYETKLRDARVLWCFEKVEGGTLITLSIDGDKPLGLRRIDSLVFTIPKFNATDRVLFFGNKLCNCTHRYPCDLAENTEYCADCTGLYEDLASPGTALAMVAPFTNVVGAGAQKTGDRLDTLRKPNTPKECKALTALSQKRSFGQTALP